MKKISFESKKYRRTILYETNKTRIMLSEDKRDRSLDRIYFVKLADTSMNEEPEVITIYRYEDEQMLEDVIRIFGKE